MWQCHYERSFFMKTKKLVLNALLIAMYVLLSYISLNLANMKITLSGLPIIVGGLLFGPVSGLEIGLLGSFLDQFLRYGITVTTLLWILPAGARGLMIGAYARHYGYRLNYGQTAFIILISAFIVTAMNTAAMYIDSKIYGYYSWMYVFGALTVRLVTAAVTSFVYLLIIPPLLKRLRMYLDR